MGKVCALEKLCFCVCVCVKYPWKFNNHCAHPKIAEVSRTSAQKLTPEILHLLQFCSYKLVLYRYIDFKSFFWKFQEHYWQFCVPDSMQRWQDSHWQECCVLYTGWKTPHQAAQYWRLCERYGNNNQQNQSLWFVQNNPYVSSAADSNDKASSLLIGDQNLEDDRLIAKFTRSRTRTSFSIVSLNLQKSRSPGVTNMLLLLPCLVLSLL